MKLESASRSIKFRTATLELTKDSSLVATFADGKTNVFWPDPAWMGPEYIEISEWAGYTCPVRYAFEHEIAHHFIADNLGWEYSWTVYTDIKFEQPWPQHIAWEEHIVNHLQRYARTRKEDPYRIIHAVFHKDYLDEKVEEFLAVSNLFIDKQLSIEYNHETGQITPV